jgi:hypothetical protein
MSTAGAATETGATVVVVGIDATVVVGAPAVVVGIDATVVVVAAAVVVGVPAPMLAEGMPAAARTANDTRTSARGTSAHGSNGPCGPFSSRGQPASRVAYWRA